MSLQVGPSTPRRVTSTSSTALTLASTTTSATSSAASVVSTTPRRISTTSVGKLLDSSDYGLSRYLNRVVRIGNKGCLVWCGFHWSLEWRRLLLQRCYRDPRRTTRLEHTVSYSKNSIKVLLVELVGCNGLLHC